MPDENDTEELDQSTTVEQDNPAELPEDPGERAAALQARLATIEEDHRRLKTENERLAEATKELDAGKKTYFRLYEEERARNAQPKETKQDTTDRFWFNEDGSPKEMADFVAERIPLREVLKRAGVVTQSDLEKQLDARVQQEATKGATFKKLVDDYPEINDSNSPLAVAAAEEFANTDPNLDQATRLELAAARAARRIKYAPKKTEDKEVQRRLNGQGGPKGIPGGKQVLTITPEMRREAKRMNGGMDVPDEVLMRTLKQQQSDRQAQRA